MGGCSGDDGALPDRRLELGEGLGVRGRLRHVELEITGRRDAGSTKIAIAFGIGRRLREAEIKGSQQCRDGMRSPPPALEGSLGKTTIDQNQWNTAPCACRNQIWPEVGFYENGEIGPPMIKETVHEPGRVQSHKLMNRSRRQAQLGNAGGGDGAGSAEHFELLVTDAGDQRDHREQLAHACAMNPGQWTQRAGNVAAAVALLATRRMLLALLEPMRNERRREWRERRGQQPIGPQGEGGPLRHDFRLLVFRFRYLDHFAARYRTNVETKGTLATI